MCNKKIIINVSFNKFNAIIYTKKYIFKNLINIEILDKIKFKIKGSDIESKYFKIWNIIWTNNKTIIEFE